MVPAREDIYVGYIGHIGHIGHIGQANSKEFVLKIIDALDLMLDLSLFCP
jgi:hypothetical protein